MSRLSRPRLSRVALLAALAACWSLPSAPAAPVPIPRKPKVEVVFCLDTTGSMSGLISGAKQKIWAISNQIANGKPTPDIRIGLVAYRDKNDDYITKVIPLTDDLDTVHANLQKFEANGGGDGPESVNQALDDAVNKIKWNKDRKVMKIIFLVGDAPPHMDYPDDVKYPQSCKVAVRKNIIINTILCGSDNNAEKIWQEIARKSEGAYAKIAQTGGVVAITTPFDKRLSEINRELAGTTVVYGRAEKRAADKKKAEAAATLPAGPAADRAGYVAKSRRAAAYDLLDAIKGGKVKLEDLKESELPEELKKLEPKERKEYLDKIAKKRSALTKEALELDKKRNAYIRKKISEKGKDSFDNQVLEALRKQAKRYKINY
jgi:Mg-chelatase subunit ChlD